MILKILPYVLNILQYLMKIFIKYRNQTRCITESKSLILNIIYKEFLSLKVKGIFIFSFEPDSNI